MGALKVSPQEAYEKVISGAAILVCAYGDDAKFRTVRLEMAIPFSEFMKKVPALSKDQEIIFY